MASILAIVSKNIFDRDFRVAGRPAGLGDVVPTTTYASAHPSLAATCSSSPSHPASSSRDRAGGYALGDLRGGAWVELPAT